MNKGIALIFEPSQLFLTKIKYYEQR